MKTLRLVGMALSAVLMCVNFASCSSEENGVPQKSKEIIVSLGIGGDYEISESPLSRATDNDLYFIQVGQIEKDASAATSAKMCAYGLFNDVSQLKIKLTEGETYEFYAFILKDAKEVLKHTENYTYTDRPFTFDVTLNNQFIFSDEASYKAPENEIIAVFYSDFTYSDDKIYQIPNIDFYHGSSVRYTAEASKNVTIYVNRASFGINFIAENLTEGSLKISMKKDSYIAPEIEISESPFSKSDVYAMTPAVSDNYSNEASLSVSFTWIKADKTEIPLGTPTITFKKNVMTTVKIKVDKTLENGIDIEYNDGTGDMADGDTYVVNGDEANLDTENK